MSDIITPDTNGTFEITTAAGTVLLLELTENEGFLTRKPGMSRPSGGSEPPRLPGDFARQALVLAPSVTVGEPGEYWILVESEAVHVVTADTTSIQAL